MAEQDHPQGTSTPDTTPANSGAVDRTFTQADIDRIVQERVRRAEESTRAKMLDELGAESFDSLTSDLSEYRKRREAEMTEAEKAAKRITALEAQLAEAQEQRTIVEHQRTIDRRNNLVAQALSAAQAIDADETVTWLELHKPDALAAALSEDGQPDPDAARLHPEGPR